MKHSIYKYAILSALVATISFAGAAQARIHQPDYPLPPPNLPTPIPVPLIPPKHNPLPPLPNALEDCIKRALSDDDPRTTEAGCRNMHGAPVNTPVPAPVAIPTPTPIYTPTPYPIPFVDPMPGSTPYPSRYLP